MLLDGSDQIDWTYLTNAFWGEELTGEWTLEILDVDGVFSDGLSWDFRQPWLADYEINFRTGTLIPGSPTPTVLLGDVDLSGTVDFGDIPAFIAVLTAGVFQDEADCDESGAVDFADIPAFIAILTSQ